MNAAKRASTREIVRSRMALSKARAAWQRILIGGVLAIPALTTLAHADDAVDRDRPAPPEDETKRQIDRTWLYVDDARIPAPMTVIAMSNVSYTSVGSSPTRIDSPYPNVYNAFASNTAQPGGMVSLGGEVGLLPRVSIMALGQMGFGGMVSSPNAGVIAGVRVMLLPPSLQNLHLVASGGYLREAWQGPVFDDDSGEWLPGSPHGDNGAWLQVAFSGDVQRLRLAGTVHGEHVFADGRDPVDIMVQLGASYRVVGPLRAGVEYVGQDLEETFDPGAESGARHFVGPIASLQLLEQRLTIVAGPSFGLSDLSPRVLGRVALAYAF
jgi:hypothetical protein